MKKTSYLTSLLIVSLTILMTGASTSAQRPMRSSDQVAILGWTDDTHYTIRTFDTEKKPVIQNVDIKSGKSTLVPPSKSERDLINESLPAGTSLGMNDIISPDGKSAVIIKDNDLWLFNMGEKELKRLTSDEKPEVNARFSPDGRKLAYTKERDLYVFDIPSGKETRLTADASKDVYNGYAAWVYYEEILGRPSRYAAFWWAPDGNKIAWLRFDETEVPVFTLNRLDEADGIHGTLEVVHYPKPGDPNPRVKMGISDLSTGKTTWVKTDYTIDQYLAWPFWTPDSRKLAIQVLNRDQNDLKIILADAATGDFRQIYDETWKTWIEFHEDVYVMKNGTGFILRSVKNGWENLYYISWDGSQLAQLTNLNFRITSVDRVDEDLKTVYFTANGTESTDRHAFRVGLDGKKLIQLT